MSEVIRCTVGLMAFNEGANIGRTLASLREQRLGTVRLDEIVVIASGCTDDTEAEVAREMRCDPRIRLVSEPVRMGKAAAVNAFIATASTPILVLLGGDVLPEPDALALLLEPFADPHVGMVGGRPVPVNPTSTFLGHCAHVLWTLHDRIACDAPKLGELVAFRNVLPEIGAESAVDEVSIEAAIVRHGYELCYERRAVVFNRGPETLADFLRQRRRIAAGHRNVRRRQGYRVATTSLRNIATALTQTPEVFATPRAAVWTLGAAGLECVARTIGAFDDMRRCTHHVWDVAATTKAAVERAPV
jgi:biofilm PGA synthesis N-glycosyltransferase PgaC